MYWKIVNAAVVEQGIEVTIELRDSVEDVAPLETQSYITQKRTVEEIKAECNNTALSKILANAAAAARMQSRSADEQFAPTLINISGTV